jgi:hypothetical protein
MTIVQIVLAAILAVWVVQYVSWGLRVTRALNHFDRSMRALHPGEYPEPFPPDSLGFP